MRINVDDLNLLPSKRLRIDYNEKLDIDCVVKPVVGELLVQAVGNGVLISGRVQTLLKLNCHVCLRPFFQSLNVEIDEQLTANKSYSHEDSPRDRELTKDDFYEVIPADGVLDIGDIVYQAVTLASPVFCRCGDDCPGPPKAEKALAAGNSASSIGASESAGKIDPRWENLKTLFSNQETGENS
ncbi:MAG: DUF177 domain-containing protein [Candidatus Obscuribacterales bacterium]|nr:DUF177 domain-containing protein [Candidatus Obscuribacterales bacterium]